VSSTYYLSIKSWVWKLRGLYENRIGIAVECSPFVILYITVFELFNISIFPVMLFSFRLLGVEFKS
jgi:hypothetical protein